MTKVPLSIKDLQISGSRDYIFITTENKNDIDFSTARIQVNFPGGTMIARDGTAYSSTTDNFDLTDPEFNGSYYEAFVDNINNKIMGITYICIATVMFLIVISIPERRTHHEQMSFMLFLQCIGLSRMREYPIDHSIFGGLLGFSQM